MNPMQLMSQIQQFRNNPAQIMSRLNIPQNLQNNPQGAIQHLMNNGAMSQQQFNQLQSMAQRLRNMPQFSQMFGAK